MTRRLREGERGRQTGRYTREEREREREREKPKKGRDTDREK